MFSGGGLVKVLAAVTALLTVATGAPRVQCVCLDPFAFECCLAASEPDATEVAPNDGRTGALSDCCARAKLASVSPSDRGEARAVKSHDCQRALVVDALGFAAEGADDGDPDEVGAAGAWVGRSAQSEQTTRVGWAERRFRSPPPDRVVLFCHFTC